MNRYNLIHQERKYIYHNIYAGQKFRKKRGEYRIPMHPEVIEAIYREDEMLFYQTPDSDPINSMNLTTLEQYYTLEDGTPYDEGLDE